MLVKETRNVGSKIWLKKSRYKKIKRQAREDKEKKRKD